MLIPRASPENRTNPMNADQNDLTAKKTVISDQ